MTGKGVDTRACDLDTSSEMQSTVKTLASSERAKGLAAYPLPWDLEPWLDLKIWIEEAAERVGIDHFESCLKIALPAPDHKFYQVLNSKIGYKSAIAQEGRVIERSDPTIKEFDASLQSEWDKGRGRNNPGDPDQIISLLGIRRLYTQWVRKTFRDVAFHPWVGLPGKIWSMKFEGHSKTGTLIPTTFTVTESQNQVEADKVNGKKGPRNKTRELGTTGVKNGGDEKWPAMDTDQERTSVNSEIPYSEPLFEPISPVEPTETPGSGNTAVDWGDENPFLSVKPGESIQDLLEGVLSMGETPSRQGQTTSGGVNSISHTKRPVQTKHPAKARYNKRRDQPRGNKNKIVKSKGTHRQNREAPPGPDEFNIHCGWEKRSSKRGRMIPGQEVFTYALTANMGIVHVPRESLPKKTVETIMNLYKQSCLPIIRLK